MLKQHPDLVGLYNIGGGAEGVGRALKERQRDQHTVFVAHGLTPAKLMDWAKTSLKEQRARMEDVARRMGASSVKDALAQLSAAYVSRVMVRVW